MPLIDVILLVDLEILEEIDAWPRSIIEIRGKVLIYGSLIEVVVYLVTEEADDAIVELDEVLLKVTLIDDGAAVFQTDPHVVKEIVDRL